MSEDKKDKDSSQDKINALKAELEELKAQEEIQKLNAEIGSLKKNISIKNKEKVENFIPSKENKETLQTFSKSGEIKKKRYIGLIISIFYVLLYNFIFFIATFIKDGMKIPGSFWFAIGCTILPFFIMLLPTIFVKKVLWRNISLLFLTAFWSLILYSILYYT